MYVIQDFIWIPIVKNVQNVIIDVKHALQAMIYVHLVKAQEFRLEILAIA